MVQEALRRSAVCAVHGDGRFEELPRGGRYRDRNGEFRRRRDQRREADPFPWQAPDCVEETGRRFVESLSLHVRRDPAEEVNFIITFPNGHSLMPTERTA